MGFLLFFCVDAVLWNLPIDCNTPHNGPLPELCITFSFALHLKILPRQHKMPATS